MNDEQPRSLDSIIVCAFYLPVVLHLQHALRVPCLPTLPLTPANPMEYIQDRSNQVSLVLNTRACGPPGVLSDLSRSFFSSRVSNLFRTLSIRNLKIAVMWDAFLRNPRTGWKFCEVCFELLSF